MNEPDDAAEPPLATKRMINLRKSQEWRMMNSVVSMWLRMFWQTRRVMAWQLKWLSRVAINHMASEPREHAPTHIGTILMSMS